MGAKKLMSWVEEAETHQKIVGDYDGPYSLGVSDAPPAFLLRVTSDDVSGFPTKVSVHGVEVPVIVRGHFVPPVPLRERR